MPHFLVQKMENLVKRWGELETSSLITANPPATTPSTNATNMNTYEDANISGEAAGDLTRQFSSRKVEPPEPPKTLPVKMMHSKSGGSISSSSPSSPPRYSDEITPIRDISLDAMSNVSTTSKTVTTTTKITTTETLLQLNEQNEIVTQEKVCTNEMKAYTDTFIINEDTKKQTDMNQIKSSSSNQLVSEQLQQQQQHNLTESSSRTVLFKKTPSIDSIKSKTIVTPFELEPNNVDDFNVISKDLNIIKLETNETTTLTGLLNGDENMGKANAGLLDVTKSLLMSNHDLKSEQQQESHTVANGDDDDSKDDIDLISNDLFDWLLWIDHTLESQLVTVGDLEEINQSIQKYNVNLFVYPSLILSLYIEFRLMQDEFSVSFFFLMLIRFFSKDMTGSCDIPF